MEADDQLMSWFLGSTAVAQPAADEGAFAANLLIESLHRMGFPDPAEPVPGTSPVEPKKIYVAGADPAHCGRYDRPLHLRLYGAHHR